MAEQNIELMLAFAARIGDAQEALNKMKGNLADFQNKIPPANQKAAESWGWNRREVNQMSGAMSQAAMSFDRTAGSTRFLVGIVGELNERMVEVGSAGKMTGAQLQGMVAGAAISMGIMGISMAFQMLTENARKAAEEVEKLLKQLETEAEKRAKAHLDYAKAQYEAGKINEKDYLAVLEQMRGQALDKEIQSRRVVWVTAVADARENLAKIKDMQGTDEQDSIELYNKRQEAQKTLRAAEVALAQATAQDKINAEMQYYGAAANLTTEIERVKVEAAQRAKDAIIPIITDETIKKMSLARNEADVKKYIAASTFRAETDGERKVTAAQKAEIASRLAAEKAAAEQRLALTSSTIGRVQGIFKEHTVAYKALGIIQATVDTYVAANKALTAGPILGPILAAMTIAAGLANVAAISGISDGGAGSPTVPSGGNVSVGSGGGVEIPGGGNDTGTSSGKIGGQQNITVYQSNSILIQGNVYADDLAKRVFDTILASNRAAGAVAAGGL